MGVYVEGYTAGNVENCPFCGSDNISYKPLKGKHRCEECKKEFYVIEDEEQRNITTLRKEVNK